MPIKPNLNKPKLEGYQTIVTPTMSNAGPNIGAKNLKFWPFAYIFINRLAVGRILKFSECIRQKQQNSYLLH